MNSILENYLKNIAYGIVPGPFESVDDAIAQMELLGHTFFLFMNEETDSMCVLYLRSDGSYGLLQPET